MKTCVDCQITKSLDKFKRDERYAQGVISQCKDCINARRRARRNSPRRDFKDSATGRECNDCSQFLPWEKFGKNSRSSTGYHYRCRSCVAKRSAVQRARPEARARRTEQTARWKAANKQRCVEIEARRRTAIKYAVTQRDLNRLKWRQRNACAVCAVIPVSYHLDHIIPVSRGGSHGIGNLQWLCPLCNMRKGAKTMTEMKKGGGW